MESLTPDPSYHPVQGFSPVRSSWLFITRLGLRDPGVSLLCASAWGVLSLMVASFEAGLYASLWTTATQHIGSMINKVHSLVCPICLGSQVKESLSPLVWNVLTMDTNSSNWGTASECRGACLPVNFLEFRAVQLYLQHCTTTQRINTPHYNTVSIIQ